MEGGGCDCYNAENPRRAPNRALEAAVLSRFFEMRGLRRKSARETAMSRVIPYDWRAFEAIPESVGFAKDHGRPGPGRRQSRYLF